MPNINEWVIPKNMDKPVETVYELKDEYKIPSWEEFAKDYESDENVVESYESEMGSYDNIGIICIMMVLIVFPFL